MTKFEVGQTYYTRSICDYDTIFRITVAKRTAKMITTTEGKRLRVSEWHGVEQVKPFGSYSMCAVIGADKPLIEEPADEWAATTALAAARKADEAPSNVIDFAKYRRRAA